MGKLDNFTDAQLEQELSRRKSRRIREVYQQEWDRMKNKRCEHGNPLKGLCNCDGYYFDCPHHCGICYCM